MLGCLPLGTVNGQQSHLEGPERLNNSFEFKERRSGQI